MELLWHLHHKFSHNMKEHVVEETLCIRQINKICRNAVLFKSTGMANGSLLSSKFVMKLSI
jgi:hypothetical protein